LIKEKGGDQETTATLPRIFLLAKAFILLKATHF
jgi:hypothetical protein